MRARGTSSGRGPDTGHRKRRLRLSQIALTESRVRIPVIGSSVAQRNFVMTLPSGETVKAEERFFVVRVANHQINGDNWSRDEKRVIREHHWWNEEELKTTREVVYPQNMVELLASIRVKSESAG